MLGMLAGLGGGVDRILVVGCEPGTSTRASACRRRSPRSSTRPSSLAARSLADLCRASWKGDSSMIRRFVTVGAVRTGRGAGRQVAPRHRPIPQDQGDVTWPSSAESPPSSQDSARSAGCSCSSGRSPTSPATGACGGCSAGVARYRIVPERSQCGSTPRSSLHPIHSSTDGLEGYIDLDAQRGAERSNLTVPPTAKLVAAGRPARVRATGWRTASCSGASTPGGSQRSTACSPPWSARR